MTRKALVLSLVIFLGINATVFCQDLLKYIPTDATIVATFNPSALNAKIPFSKLKEYGFYKMSMEEMAKSLDTASKDEMLKLLDDPSNYGIDLMATSYIFGKVTSEGNAFSYIFKLSDPAKFSQFFKSKLPPDTEIIAMDGYEMVAQNNDMAVAWTNEFVLITGVEVHRKYDDYGYDYNYGADPNSEEDIYYEDQEIMEEQEMMEEAPIEEMEIVEEDVSPYGEVEEIEEVIVEDVEEEIEAPIEEMEIVEEEDVYQEAPVEEELGEVETMEYPDIVVEQPYYDDSAELEHAQKEKDFTLNWVKMVMGSDGSNSIMKHPKFTIANAKKTDASLWLDYEAIYGMYMDGMGSYMGEADMFTALTSSLYNDTYMSMGVNFDAGAVNFNIDSYANSQMMKFYRESTDAKFNKKFHKYVPAENLMGYWNFNINFENTVEGYKELFMPMLSSIPIYGGMAKEMVDIVDIFIDEEAVYDLWDGDVFFAVTGMKDFERTITTFEFDEDFNRIETQQTITQKLPEFIMMSSFENEENVRKFLKLGESSSYLENKGNYYLVKIPNEDMDLYIALHKGIFFFTNNSDLILNRLNKGYSKKERLSKAHCKQIKDNAMVLYWDIPQTLNAASAFGIPLAGPQGKMLNVSKDSFKSVVWTMPKVGEQVVSQSLSLNFVNNEMNSMEQIFNYINEMFMMMMGDTSM